MERPVRFYQTSMLTWRMLVLLPALMIIFGLGAAAMRRLGQAHPSSEIAWTATDRERDGATPHIWRLDLDHALTFNFSRHSTLDFSPVWSPDGNSLLLLSNRDSGMHLYIAPADGGAAVRLTPQPGYYVGFRVSADGERVVFIGVQGAAQTLYSVRADGSDLTMLTQETHEIDGMLMDIGMDAGSIAPQQSRPALSLRFREGVWGLYMAQSEAGGTMGWRWLASVGRGSNEFPAWSPDGTQVAYISDIEGTSDIYTVEVATGIIRRRTHDEAVESVLQWRPVQPAAPVR